MKTSFARPILFSALMLIPCSAINSQQSSQVQRTLQFENENVKVWKTIVMPNAPLTMHTHEHPRVIIALSGGTMKVVQENGPSDVHQWETGKAYWLSAEQGQRRHADVNEGDKPIEVMVVELKSAK